MNDEIYSDGGFEDISSSTVPKTKSSLKAVTENYGNGVFKHLDKIIKAISFIVALMILLVFATVAAVQALFLCLDFTFLPLSMRMSALMPQTRSHPVRT